MLASTKSGEVAVDPGIRTFATTYDPTGEILHIGEQDQCRIKRLLKHIDALQAKSTDPSRTRRSRYKVKKAYLRAHMRLRNVVHELHHQVTNHLVTNYDVILYPSFGTAAMLKRPRRIPKWTARVMQAYSFYKFKMLLLWKAGARGSRVEIVSEAYTSKTCTSCGKIDDKLGGKKVYTCSHCALVLDRDVNAARNIYLRNFSLI